jgi:hypothetical protein
VKRRRRRKRQKISGHVENPCSKKVVHARKKEGRGGVEKLFISVRQGKLRETQRERERVRERERESDRERERRREREREMLTLGETDVCFCCVTRRPTSSFERRTRMGCHHSAQGYHEWFHFPL